MNNVIINNLFIKIILIIVVTKEKFLRNFKKSDFLLTILLLI